MAVVHVLPGKRTMVTAEEYHQLIEVKARIRWEWTEPARRYREWKAALRQLGLHSNDVSPNHPLYGQVEEIAEGIYRENRMGYALDDWLLAEKEVSQKYYVVRD